MPRRKLTERNRSKHVGHASEGHLRGLLLHLPGVTSSQISRALPFKAPVESDAILLDKRGKLRAIFVVAFWDHAGSSEKKLYRTRTEFNEIGRVQSLHPEFFASDFRVITVLYGSDSGWKEQVLADLLSECAPALFLPRLLGARAATKMVDEFFSEYADHWEAGRANAREHVENSVAQRALSETEKKVLRAVQKCLTQKLAPNNTHHDSRSSVRLPPSPTRTRYRQALGVLSLFPNDEIEHWLQHRSPMRHVMAEKFVRRAVFLDMGRLILSSSITGKTSVSFAPRSAQTQAGDYAPDRPDFSSWQQCAVEDLRWILDAHREKAGGTSVVFAGGALDQCFGNYNAICVALAAEGAALGKLLQKGDTAGAAARLVAGVSVSCESWQPSFGRAVVFPLWGIAASALAMARSDRAIRSEYDARRQTPPESSTAKDIARQLVKSEDAQHLVREVVRYASLLPTARLEDVARLQQPRLLQLDEPCSWIADAYMTLTTNSSHNPLNEVLIRWLSLRFPKRRFRGWPEKRSIALSLEGSGAESRRQWCTLGVNRDSVIAAETKAVTANNWGNKSKEIYDRVSELRRVATKAGIETKSILLFDGDLTDAILTELATGIGHDEVWTVDEILVALRAGGS
jgi:hypothetical protein